MWKLIGALLALVVTVGVDAAAQQKPVDPNRWEPEIQKFEAEDKQNPPVKGGVVFIGSSSIARWSDLAESFPNLKVVNRGFGGFGARRQREVCEPRRRSACAANRRPLCWRKRPQSRSIT